MLATPLDVADVATGEIGWAMLRGLLYAVMFFVVALCLGLVHHPIAVASIPAAVLIGFAFASLGAAATCYARTWDDFEYTRVGVLVLFLFSATFYPLATYPRGLQIVVELSPLYQGVAMERGLFAGVIDTAWWLHALYLGVIGITCLRVVSRRLARLLKP
jgi:lipooligosaccharide transport system permease protein